MSWLITGAQPVPVDLNRSNVSLLLHGDGTNGSTTITDNSPSPKTVTAFGNAQISTAESKFGGSSILFDGANSESVNASALKAGVGDGWGFGVFNFTIEAWIRISAFPSYSTIAATRLGGTGSANQWSLTVVNDVTNATNALALYSNSFFLTANNVLSLNTWHHVAATRAGSSLRLFVDGAVQGTHTNTQNFAPALLSIGGSHRGNGNGVELFNGYIDDLRITKGVARYTANFTPPTAPFPDI